MISFGLLVAYIGATIVSVLFWGFWLFMEKKFLWTFWAALIPFVFMWVHLHAVDWKGFATMAFLFLVFAHLYGFDAYFTFYKARRRNRI